MMKLAVLVGVGPLRPIRWCRRHLRLIDPMPRVWFHACDEISMKPLERLTDRVSVRSVPPLSQKG